MSTESEAPEIQVTHRGDNVELVIVHGPPIRSLGESILGLPGIKQRNCLRCQVPLDQWKALLIALHARQDQPGFGLMFQTQPWEERPESYPCPLCKSFVPIFGREHRKGFLAVHFSAHLSYDNGKTCPIRMIELDGEGRFRA